MCINEDYKASAMAVGPRNLPPCSGVYMKMARYFYGSVLSDVRVALRMFERDRRFTVAALTAIALAVGGATAIMEGSSR